MTKGDITQVSYTMDILLNDKTFTERSEAIHQLCKRQAIRAIKIKNQHNRFVIFGNNLDNWRGIISELRRNATVTSIQNSKMVIDII